MADGAQLPLPSRKPGGAQARTRGGTGALVEGIDYGPLAEWLGFHLRMAQISSFQAFAREVGIPGGGAVTNAPTLALFYQALLRDGRPAEGAPIWRPDALAAALRVRTGDLTDPWFGTKANRALGVVVAGDEQERAARGFGRTNSPEAFGHNGAGGQVAWGDPATGISFAFLTNTFDRNPIRQGRRGLALSSRAAACGR